MHLCLTQIVIKCMKSSLIHHKFKRSQYDVKELKIFFYRISIRQYYVPEGIARDEHLNVQDLVHRNHAEATQSNQFGVATWTLHLR